MSQPMNTSQSCDLTETLIDIHQRRMDRCQSEQYWIVASWAVLNGFILTNKSLILAHASFEAVLFVLSVFLVVMLIFILDRQASYHRYRNTMSDLLVSKGCENVATCYMKKKSHLFDKNSMIWIGVFSVFILAPFSAQIFLLKQDAPLSKDQKPSTFIQIQVNLESKSST